MFNAVHGSKLFHEWNILLMFVLRLHESWSKRSGLWQEMTTFWSIWGLLCIWIGRLCRVSSPQSPCHPYSCFSSTNYRRSYALMCLNHGTPSTTWSGLKPSELVEGDTMSLTDRILTPVEEENFAIWSKRHKLGFIHGSIAVSGFLWCILPSLTILKLFFKAYGFEHGEKNRACCCERRVFLIT